MTKLNYTDLSRILSHALRHEPWIYELELDDEGWTSTDAVLEALRAVKPVWRNLEEADLEVMIARSEKRRHELLAGRIRAIYGHSIPGKLKRTPAMPPEVLYHGTSPDVLDGILEGGLLPMNRQYVHLSVDTQTAMEVGRRKHHEPVLLRVRALDAHHEGVAFYEGNERVWLADEISASYLGVSA